MALLALLRAAQKLPTPVVEAIVELVLAVIARESDEQIRRRGERIAFKAAYERVIRGGR